MAAEQQGKLCTTADDGPDPSDDVCVPSWSAENVALIPAINTDPVFVFACCQRSGTTLLQRLLNSHPDLMIWGEHHGYLNHFLAGYQIMSEWKADHSCSVEDFLRLAPSHFLPNVMPDTATLDEAFRRHVSALFPVPAHRGVMSRWGFKETRYAADVAFFLERLFPGARFIHLVRHVDDCVASMRGLERKGLWQSEWTEQGIENWLTINRSFLDASSKLNHYLLVRYEDLNGPNRAMIVGQLERFIDVSPGTLDQSVLERHIDYEGAPERLKRPSAESHTMAQSAGYSSVLVALGYG